MCTQRKMAEQHAEAKHANVGFDVCFPNIDEIIANSGAKIKAAKGGKKDDKKK